MRKKRILAILLAASMMVASPAVAMMSTTSVYAADVGDNPAETTVESIAAEDSMTNNNGTVTDNSGAITNNNGTVTNNNGAITTNNKTVVNNNGTGMIDSYLEKKGPTESEDFGSIDPDGNGIKDVQSTGEVTVNNGDIVATEDGSKIGTNNGKILYNHGDVTTNESNGNISSNESDGEITTNDGNITYNKGIVNTNSSDGSIKSNESDGKITTNEGYVDWNYGEIKNNKGYVKESKGTITNTTGYVGENWESGVVKVTAKEGQSFFDAAVEAVRTNYGTIEVKQGETTKKIFAIVGDNGLTGKDKFHGVLANVLEGDNYTLGLTNSIGIDGDVLLSKTNTGAIGNFAELNLEETEDHNYYIVPMGTTLKVNDVIKFAGVWYRIIAVTPNETVIEEVHDSSDGNVVEAPVPQMTTSSVAGVTINDWADVSNVLTTMSDKIVADPVSDKKVFSLDLTTIAKKEVPVEVITSLTASDVDAVTCTIAEGTAVTFNNDASLASYIPTDFSMTPRESDTMKTLNFFRPQDIGVEVTISTTVPVKGSQVVIWQLVDGQFVLLAVVESDENGEISFPISNTGNIAITY